MFRLCLLALVLPVVAVAAPVPKEKDKEKDADKEFSDVTPDQIAATLKAAGKAGGEKIVGSDAGNRLPAGTVVVYQTSEGRRGKLKVVEHGYDLTVKWVTYEKDGTVASKGDALVVKGTFTAELDAGKSDAQQGRDQVDFWWPQQDKVTRHLVPMNGATFAVYEPKKDK